MAFLTLSQNEVQGVLPFFNAVSGDWRKRKLAVESASKNELVTVLKCLAVVLYKKVTTSEVFKNQWKKSKKRKIAKKFLGKKSALLSTLKLSRNKLALAVKALLPLIVLLGDIFFEQ